MRICRYTTSTGATLGLVSDDERVVPIAEVAARAGTTPPAGTSPVPLLDLPVDERGRLEGALVELARNGAARGDVELLPPIADPEKILCLGLNYRDHAEEAGLPLPAAPILFPKFREALIGSGAAIVPPGGESMVDYEAELAAVIGGGGRDIPVADALAHVGAYAPFNDVSARELQNVTPQWTAGKAIDTFGPIGPYLTTSDAVADPQALGLRARVNGETVQDGTTADMIFSIAEQIAFISSLMTLRPGDVIATGTPAGVGFIRTPQVLLSEGDVVEIEVDGLGTLSNPVAAPRPATAASGYLRAGQVS